MQTPLSTEQLENALRRYEGAVNATERDGDDSAEAVQELDDARAALLDILQAAKIIIERPAFIVEGAQSGRIQTSEPNFTEVERRAQLDHLPEGSH